MDHALGTGTAISLAVAVAIAVAAMHRSRGRRAGLERRERLVAEREAAADRERAVLRERADDLDRRLSGLDELRSGLEAERRRLLEEVAGLGVAEARAEVEHQARLEAARTVRELEEAARREGEDRARRIVTTVIQRVAAEQTAEASVAAVPLPSEEMKGRIIGREGRNIRTFEHVTGVNLIVDDTPGAVLVSCFDPVRRETARVCLDALVTDGRIHPYRIEEEFERARAEVDLGCLRAGEKAVLDLGITDMHPELVALLGRLRLRTSYGQNVLAHLVETAHVAGLMADELGLSRALLSRCALLHDVGKALTHEVPGSHALVGAEVARRFGEHEDVVHAIEAHHDEVRTRSVEAVLTQAADAVSGGRPGVRRQSAEEHASRLRRLEEIGGAHPGVDRVYAMQAGREVRVMVLPERVDDAGARLIARSVARRVEQELTYPGRVRVTVVRESRAVEYAR